VFKLPKNNLLKYYLAIVATYIIWAAAGPVVKITMDYVPVFTFLLIRFLIVCIILLPFVYIELKKTHIHPKDMLKIIILGLFSQSAIALIFFGIKYTTVLEASIIGVLGPILTVYAGHYFFNEKISKQIKIGLFIASLGTLYVALKPILEIQQNTADASLRLLGNFLVILFTLSFVLYMIWSKLTMGESSRHVRQALKFLHMKPMKKHYSPTLLTALSFYIGLITFIPFVVLEKFGYLGAQPFSFSSLTVVPVLGILYMAIFSSIAAYMFFEWGLTKVDVKDTAIFKYLEPIFTIPFAYLLLGEIPTPYMIVGGIVIASGVVIAEYKRK